MQQNILRYQNAKQGKLYAVQEEKMITFYEKDRVFKLDTPHTSYLIGIVDEENFIGHIY